MLQIPPVDGRNRESIHNKCKHSEGLGLQGRWVTQRTFPYICFSLSTLSLKIRAAEIWVGITLSGMLQRAPRTKAELEALELNGKGTSLPLQEDPGGTGSGGKWE